MNQYQGFSLIEVLLALSLTTSVMCHTLYLQREAQTSLNQIRLHARGSAILDRVSEELLLGGASAFNPEEPYLVHIETNSQQFKMQLDWPHDQLTRLYHLQVK